MAAFERVLTDVIQSGQVSATVVVLFPYEQSLEKNNLE
jgi:hypothetical protein